MAFAFSTGAVIRLLSAQVDDELVIWVEGDSIRPFITASTMAAVRFSIRTTDRVSHDQRALLERRYDRLARDLNADRREQVAFALFDLKAAEILSDILVFDAGRDALSDMDLLPAAVAIQHNLELVVTDDIIAWESLANAIPAELGRLVLKIFESKAE
jgi:predicted nucleic acid-binding protein